MVLSRLWPALDAYTPALRASFATHGAALPTTAPDMDVAVSLYAVADGQNATDAAPFPPGVVDAYYWMSLAEVNTVREDLDGMARVGEWDDAKTRVINWWVPGWLPLLTDGNSNYICIDTVGSFGGNVGQIIEFIHDDADRLVLAPSFNSWFAAWVTALEAKAYKLDADTSDIVPAYELTTTAAVRKLFATQLPGYPKRHKATKEKITAPKKPAAKRTKAPANAQLLGVFKERMSVTEVASHLAAGADVQVRDREGNTPLHLAMAFGNEAVPEALMAAGANVNARNNAGLAPIHLAVLQKPRAATLLITALAKAGADINAPSPNGTPPIISALSIEAAEALIVAGVASATFATYPAEAWLDPSVARAMLSKANT